MKRIPYVLLLMLFLLIFVENIVIAQPYPLQAHTMSIYNPVTSAYDRWDSTWYYYSGGRSGTPAIPHAELSLSVDLDDYNIHHDAAISLTAIGGSTSYNKTVNTYDIAGHLETETRYVKDGTGTWQPSMRNIFTYTGDNMTLQLTEEWNGTAWADSSKATYHYNTHNDVDTIILEENNLFTGYVWANFRRIITSFDIAYRKTDILTQKPYGTNWRNFNLDRFMYDAGGKLVQHTLSEWLPDAVGTPTWFEYERTNYAYNSSNDAVADTTYSLESTGIWSISNIDSNEYDAAHNLLMTVTQLPDPVTGIPAIARKYDWTYNSFNQCTSLISHTWDEATSSWILYTDPTYTRDDYMHQYYYGAGPNVPEDTTLSTGRVHVLSSAGVDARIFPCPANDFVQLSLSWNDVQPFRVCLYNVEGQLLGTWNESGIKQYNRSVNMANHPAGNYFFKITCSDGSMVSPFAILR